MKPEKVKSIILSIICVIVLSGCYGSFALTRKLYKWNGTIGNKWGNSAVMCVLGICQVYSIAGFFDFAVINTIEFWSGENPVAMGENDLETRVVEKDGRKYRVTARRNRLDIESINRKDNHRASLVYYPGRKEWFLESEDKNIKLAKEKDENILELYGPGDMILRYDLNHERVIGN